jgi:hypothetical protein
MASYISSFVSYLVGSSDNAANKTQTENGACVMDTSNHPGVDAFQKIVRVPTTKEMGWRDEPAETKAEIRKHISNMLQTASARWHETNNPAGLEYLVDAFLLAAHKRAVKRTTHDATSFSLNSRSAVVGLELSGNSIVDANSSGSPSTVAGGDTPSSHNGFGGEGERMIFARMMIELYNEYPKTVSELIPLIPQLGCWQDLYMIWALSVAETDIRSMDIAVPIIKCLVGQLVSDAALLDNPDGPKQTKNVSLAAKWVAREGSYWDKKCHFTDMTCVGREQIYSYTALTGVYHLAVNLGMSAVAELQTLEHIARVCDTIHNISWEKKKLRKLISRICAGVDVFEQKACSGKWSEIAPGKVPSRAMSKYSKAFLNEKLNTPPNKSEMLTGNRYPDNPDRVNARSNLISFMSQSRAFKTDGLDPHEIMNKFQATKSPTERELILKQWLSKVDAIYDEIMSAATVVPVEADVVELNYDSFDGVVARPDTRKAVLVPMMDVSGSMSGKPMEVAVGLGIFLTYLQEKMGVPPFAVSFTEQPRAFDFKGMSLEERIAEVNSNVGYNTNFWSAIELVLQAMVRTCREMDLIVFTDMQWDTAETSEHQNPATTMHQRILERVAALGLKTAPRIIYWNLRARTPGVQTEATQEGVQFLQGYSASLLRFALLGEDMPTKTITLEDGSQVNVKSITPYETYRKALDSPRFAKWREVIMSSSEGLLVHLPSQ